MDSLFAVKQALIWSGSSGEVLKLFKTTEEGLPAEEVNKRLKFYGPNEIGTAKKRPIIFKFLSKFLNPLILILIFASLIAGVLGQLTDFLVIVVIVIASASIDFYQEYSAEGAAEKLSKKVALTASVIRNGQKQEIPVSQIVPGEVIYLSAGDIIPADARLLTSKELLVNQASLTGESFPQEKTAEPIKKDKLTVIERTNLVFMGCSVISGEALAVVAKIGSWTELGRLAKDLNSNRPETEFQIGVRKFGLLLLKITLALTIGVFLINSFLQHDLLSSLLFALALAVGLTPELLPLILTINLSKGAMLMSKKGVIVKDLPAIQNFGSMNILCTDKTGTLTEDKIRLERYEDINAQENKDVLRLGFINSHFQTGLKSPLEKAILEHKEVLIHDYIKLDEIPFDFKRRALSIIVKTQAESLLITKGAPETVFGMCTKVKVGDSIHSLTSQQRAKIAARFKTLSSQGFRVLALAYKKVEHQRTYYPKDEADLILMGLMAFLDPPKESAKEALKLLEKQGILLKVLTGDNELVTKKVCEELGLFNLGITTGGQINHLNEHELATLCQKTTIFARVDPEQKQRILLSLKQAGAVVGFLGDGINDAASLRSADIGISVNNAVDVAKQSADLILLHKDLHVLKDGVYEGRRTYANIMKYIMMASSSNFGNIFSVAAASIFLPFLPMLPVQILLTNLMYDISQLGVAEDNVNVEFLDKPRKWDIKFIKHFMFIFGPISSSFDFLTFFILLLIFRATEPVFQTGWFVEGLVTQILIVFSIRTRAVPFFKSKPSKLLILSSLLIAVLGLYLPFSPLAPFFSFTKVPLDFYLVIGLIVILYFLAVEVVKDWFYHKFSL